MGVDVGVDEGESLGTDDGVGVEALEGAVVGVDVGVDEGA